MVTQHDRGWWKGGLVLTAATCSLIGVHLLADAGEGGSAISNAAAIGLALGMLLVLLGLLWLGMPRPAVVATGLAGRGLTTCPTTTAAADPTAHQSPPP